MLIVPLFTLFKFWKVYVNQHLVGKIIREIQWNTTLQEKRGTTDVYKLDESQVVTMSERSQGQLNKSTYMKL